MSRFATIVSFLALALLLSATTAPRAEEAAGLVIRAEPATPGETAPSVVRAPRTAEEQALFELGEATRARVEELVRGMTGLPDGPVLRALQRKVEEVKQQERLEFLGIKLDFARRRGDLATAQECERLIERILNPPAPAVSPDSRALERARQEGGRP
jgi:hypothetical protein